MPTNEFLPFAVGGGANVMPQADWAALPDRQTGFQAGTAYSLRVNKALRQSAAMAAALGVFSANRGPVSALDDGNIAGLEASFATAAARFGSLCGFVNDTGIVNNVVVTLDPNPLAYYEGMALVFVPGTTNTGPTGLSVNGLGNRPVLRRDGTQVAAGDLQQGAPCAVRYLGGPIGGAFRLISFAQSEVTRIVASPILYVRPDGSDANKGSANTPSQAFATITAALAYGVNFLAYTGTLLTIQLGVPGTYNAPSTSGIFGSNGTLLGGAGTVQIVGDTSNQDAYTIAGTGFAGNNGIIHNSFGTNLTLKGVRIENNNPNNFDHIRSASNGTVYIEYVTLAGLNGTVRAHLCSSDGGGTKIGPGVKVTSSMARCFWSNGGGIVLAGNVVLVGTLSFADAFCVVDSNGRFQNGGASITGGTVTGKRYSVNSQGSINTGGGGANYFPGSVAGTSFSADQYL